MSSIRPGVRGLACRRPVGAYRCSTNGANREGGRGLRRAGRVNDVSDSGAAGRGQRRGWARVGGTGRAGGGGVGGPGGEGGRGRGGEGAKECITRLMIFPPPTLPLVPLNRPLEMERASCN